MPLINRAHILHFFPHSTQIFFSTLTYPKKQTVHAEYFLAGILNLAPRRTIADAIYPGDNLVFREFPEKLGWLAKYIFQCYLETAVAMTKLNNVHSPLAAFWHRSDDDWMIY